MIEKYRAVISKQTSFSDIINKVINTYNNQPHITIKSTPNKMFDDVRKQNMNNGKENKFNRDVLNIYIYIYRSRCLNIRK